MTKNSKFLEVSIRYMSGKFNNLDVIIIGGGPGGLSAAFWCAELGLKAALFEKEPEFGGQLLWTFNSITNYLGIEEISGRELRDKFLQHVENKHVQLVCGISVNSVDLKQKSICLSDGRRLSAKAIIIATGVRRRQLGVPGESEFRNRGILDSGVRSKNEVAGKTVLIVGGGNAAVENAAILCEVAEKVILVHRRDKFTARQEFVKRIEIAGNIDIIFNSQLVEIFGSKSVEGVIVKNISTGMSIRIATDAVLIRVGAEPNTSLFDGQLTSGSRGYIEVNHDRKTSVTAVFAIGDVANPLTPTISSAVGTGATAVKTIAANIRAKNLDDVQ